MVLRKSSSWDLKAGVPQGHGGGAGSGGSDCDSNSNGSGARSPGGASPFAVQQHFQHQAQYQQQHQAQQQPEEQHQERQVWSRTGLVPVADNPDSEREMRRQLDTKGVCYGML
ncbi:unnamed protein product [Ectocarpus sp. CCAP 1310/34]|nr:unnamed protein product [Ectocarpus sp. CCAP 1310/34]